MTSSIRHQFFEFPQGDGPDFPLSNFKKKIILVLSLLGSFKSNVHTKYSKILTRPIKAAINNLKGLLTRWDFPKGFFVYEQIGGLQSAVLVRVLLCEFCWVCTGLRPPKVCSRAILGHNQQLKRFLGCSNFPSLWMEVHGSKMKLKQFNRS